MIGKIILIFVNLRLYLRPKSKKVLLCWSVLDEDFRRREGPVSTYQKGDGLCTLHRRRLQNLTRSGSQRTSGQARGRREGYPKLGLSEVRADLPNPRDGVRGGTKLGRTTTVHPRRRGWKVDGSETRPRKISIIYMKKSHNSLFYK